MSDVKSCPDCGLPFAECGALAMARHAAEKFLREDMGYDSERAQVAAERLIPEATRPESPTPQAVDWRERAAKVAEDTAMPIYDDSEDWCTAYNDGCRDAAAAIRAVDVETKS